MPTVNPTTPTPPLPPAPAAGTRGFSVWPWLEPGPAGATPAVGAASPASPGDGVAWPKISLVTPNYNGADQIEATLRSVLAQGYPNLEYVVIDDGSKDDSPRVIEKYAPLLSHWDHRPNRGQYATINEGFTHTTGEVMAWLNSDEIFMPWTLRAVGYIFARFPDVQWVIGHPTLIQHGTIHRVMRFTPYPRLMVRSGLFHGGPGGLGWIQQQSMFWRRGLWEKAGELKLEFGLAADYELNIRFADHAELYATTSVLAGYHHQGERGRSVAGRERYIAEVNGVMTKLADDPELAKVHRDVRLFEKVQRYPGVRGIARRLMSIPAYRGPVLRWDFDSASYGLVYESFFNRRFGR
jgi:GT2 family glycosyltransferase